MNYFLMIAIFCIILFIYLHIQFHLKTSSDLELFEIYDTTKDILEDVCDMRQPAVFSDLNPELVNSVIFNINTDALIDKYSQFHVHVRELNNSSNNNNDVEYASLPLSAAVQLMNSSAQYNNNTETSAFFSENNGDFLAETSALKNIPELSLEVE
jgi:hypothetical protein